MFTLIRKAFKKFLKKRARKYIKEAILFNAFVIIGAIAIAIAAIVLIVIKAISKKKEETEDEFDSEIFECGL